MANRRFRSQFQYGFEAMPVSLHCVFDVGASGAPTLNQTLSKGVESIARNSAGQYTITLEDKYNGLLHATIDQRPGTSPPAAPLAVVEAEDVDGAKTVVLQYRDIDNSTATDPADGEQQRLHLILSNSNVGGNPTTGS